MKARKAWRLTKTEWDALPYAERDAILAYEHRHLMLVRKAYEGLKETKPMDSAGLVALLLEQI